MQENKKILILLLRTWTNDIGGIYDYSTKAVKVITDNIVQSTYVVRDKNNFFDNVGQHSEIPNSSELLFHVLNNNKDNYLLINPIPKNLKLSNDNCIYLNNKIWYVIKSEVNLENENNNEEYFLLENDIIKLGKIKFAVQKIHIENANNSEEPPMPQNGSEKYDISKLNQNSDPVFDFIFKVKYSKNAEKNNNNSETPSDDDKKKVQNNDKEVTCFICKQEKRKQNESETDDGESDILISLCNCKEKGLAHRECFRKNFNVKIENKPKDKSITIENFECPNCKEQYPLKYRFENENEIKFLIDEYKEEEKGDYIILESLDYYKDEKYCKSIHIINLKYDHITIGREAENDVVEKDISISRSHAVLNYNRVNYKICLQNRSKKFGTLVLIKKPIKILDGKIHLQIGRTYIEAHLEVKN